MRVAAVQLDAGSDRHRNLDSAERLVRQAAADGASLVVLPEHFDLRGTDDDYVHGAEPPGGPTPERARPLAPELGIDPLAGAGAARPPGPGKTAETPPP